jgi:hypothetical protein
LGLAVGFAWIDHGVAGAMRLKFFVPRNKEEPWPPLDQYTRPARPPGNALAKLSLDVTDADGSRFRLVAKSSVAPRELLRDESSDA